MILTIVNKKTNGAAIIFLGAICSYNDYFIIGELDVFNRKIMTSLVSAPTSTAVIAILMRPLITMIR